jgi:hypothetical protein
MLEMLGSEGVITVGVGLLVVGLREWRRVWLAREWRREREQELLTQMVVEVADGGRGVVVCHDGTSGGWSVTCDGSTRKSDGQRRKSVRHSAHALVDERMVPAHRRRR